MRLKDHHTNLSSGYTNQPPAKPHVLLIHGLGLDHLLWNAVLPLLTRKNDVTLVGLPGHGTEPVIPNVSWDVLCDKVIAAMDRTGIAQAHLIGHGLGANISIKTALRHPQRIRSLGLISLPGYIPAEFRKRMIEERARLLNQTDRSCFIERMVPVLTAMPERADIRSLLADAMSRFSTSCYLQLMQLFVHNDIVGDLTRITTPTLSLCGESDPIYTPAFSAITASYMAGSRFLVVPNASNLVFLDQPHWTACWLQDHIDSAAGAPPSSEPPAGSASGPKDGTVSLHKVLHLGDREPSRPQELQVQLLHTFRITVNGSEVKSGWNRRYAKQLLLYLLLFPGCTRQQLYDDLWPDLELRKAQNYLRVCLNHLKSLFEPFAGGFEFLHTDGENLSINGTVQCDLIELICELYQAVEERDDTKKEARILRIWSKLPRHILTGYTDDWILETRDKVEGQLAELAVWMLQRTERSETGQAESPGFSHRLLRDYFREDQEE